MIKTTEQILKDVEKDINYAIGVQKDAEGYLSEEKAQNIRTIFMEKKWVPLFEIKKIIRLLNEECEQE